MNDVSQLEKAWTSAGDLALKFMDQEKALEVVRRAGSYSLKVLETPHMPGLMMCTLTIDSL